MLRNHPEFVYAMVANSQLGLVTVPIDPRAWGDRLRYFITFAGCSALVVADYILAEPQAAEVIQEVGLRAYALSTAEGRAQGLSIEGWPSLNEVFEGPEREDVGQHVDTLDHPWFLSYTSGTTGAPKYVSFVNALGDPATSTDNSPNNVTPSQGLIGFSPSANIGSSVSISYSVAPKE